MQTNQPTDSNFWLKLKKPIFGLAPMDGVTDHPYRHIQKKYGRPAVIYTEFATVEGFCRGVTVPLRDFIFDQTQRPIVAQIYGKTPRFFRETATVICQLGFDGIDINMGCPAKSVANGGAGAGLIKTPQLAQEIIKATREGVQDWVNGKTVSDCEHMSPFITQEVVRRHVRLASPDQAKKAIPVSIKTRIGFDKPIIEQWLPILLETKPALIAIHGRTLRQGYSGKADWSQIGQAVTIAQNSNTLIMGNGDVSSQSEALEKVREYGVDGVLIGRASFGNPWVFDKNNNRHQVSTIQKTKVALEHAQLYEETFSQDEKYSFLPMRKHLGWYMRGFNGAKEVRQSLMKTNSSLEVELVMAKHGLA